MLIYDSNDLLYKEKAQSIDRFKNLSKRRGCDVKKNECKAR